MQYRLQNVIMAMALVVFVGGGCSKVVPAQKSPEFLPNQDLASPKDAWSEYQSAKPAAGGAHQEYKNEPLKRAISIVVPSDWSGDGGVWKAPASNVSHLRTSYFATLGPETEWSQQQAIPDIQTVVHADKNDGVWTLMVNNLKLKASILKLFIQDDEHPSKGFYMVECSVAYDALDRAALWSACRAAVESAQVAVIR